MNPVKAVKHLLGFLTESARLILLFFWLQQFPLPWNGGTEFNLFFLFLISPQIVLPLAWLLGLRLPVSLPYVQAATSARWVALGVDLAAAVWLLRSFGFSLSVTSPEFILALLIGLADLTIIILLKGKSPKEAAGDPE